jgi:hypothetical protein
MMSRLRCPLKSAGESSWACSRIARLRHWLEMRARLTPPKTGLGRPHVVAVEAGDGERLEDMQFDQFHLDFVDDLRAEVSSAER